MVAALLIKGVRHNARHMVKEDGRKIANLAGRGSASAAAAAPAAVFALCEVLKISK
jgi:hypothetical protein